MRVIKGVSDDQKKLLTSVLENFESGANVKTLRQALKLIDIIEESDDEITLEDADHGFLVQRFDETNFVRADRLIVETFDKLDEAETTPRAVKAG